MYTSRVSGSRIVRLRRRGGVVVLLAMAASLVLVPGPGAGAQSGAPATPSSVSVARADGTLTASWPAVAGATSYHVTYSSDSGSSWSLAALNHTASSITISGVTNSDSYIVGVRARNSSGDSGWRNSPAAGPWTPPAPSAPVSVSVLRDDGTLEASWAAVAGATSYHITYSSDSGKSWSLAALNHTESSITINGAMNEATYIVGVRARNSSGDSGWRNSPAAGPWTPPAPSAPVSVSVTRADGTLTASWAAVAGATSYHVTYTSDSGKSWSLAALNHTASSITITGVTNSASYVVGVRARNAGGDSGWRNSPSAGPWSSPGAVQNLTVDPDDGYLDIDWDAVAGATGYDVRAKAQNSTTWHSVADNIAATSHRYTTTTTIDYIAVRARNNNNTGPWTEKSRLPSDDLSTEYNTGTASGATATALGAESGVQPANTKLATPTLGTITREWLVCGRLKLCSRNQVQWSLVSGADGYNFVCSYYGWQWNLCGWEDSSDTVQYTTVPSSQSQPLAITHYWRQSGYGTPGKYNVTATRGFMVAVRAVKTNDDSAASGWATSEVTRLIDPALSGFSYTRSDGQITMTWNPVLWATDYEFECDVYVQEEQADYTTCATLTGQAHTDSQHSVTISTWNDGGNNYSIDNTKTYDIAMTSTNKWSEGYWLVPLVDPITLTASGVTSTSAVLTLAEYTGAWWLKQTIPGSSDCKSKGTATAAGATENLSGLTPGYSYTYGAYSDSSCENEIVSESFTTPGHPSVSNLSESSSASGVAVYSGNHAATGFDIGSSANGYTLKSVTVKIWSVGTTAGDLSVAVHEDSSGNPASTAAYTLTGTNPTLPGEATFTCPTNTTCTLSDTDGYFLVLKGTGATSSNAYSWETTLSNGQTNTPGDFGWTIADDAKRYTSSAWGDQTGSGLFKVSATINPILTVTGVSATGATLNLAHQGGASWYYKANTGPHTACQGPVTANTQALTGLTSGATYTYYAYSDSTCATGTILDTADEFTTP